MIPFFLHRLSSRVSDVCFKFTRPEGQIFRRLQENLNNYEISFKSCTVLVPFNATNIGTLHSQVECFFRALRFDSCSVQSSLFKITYGTDDFSKLDEWFSMIE
jgi:hypothetical protein